ncbi:MAG: SDR family oxidoreductase [Alphaproteobacteria bacterium]|nr:MAG: SDR family oxidoreductase [Alphaproteobacteria bacterium]
MDLGLAGKRAVVTGGSSGIGLATARKLLAEGALVAICARGAERLEQAAGTLRAEFGVQNLVTHAADVLDAQAVAGLAEAVRSRFGGCDILINNAGQGRLGSFAETSDADWRAEYELKLFSQINPARAFEAMLREARGALVAVNSLLAIQPEPHMVATASARAGVQNLIKSLAREWAPQVRVNSILLGLVISGQWERRFAAREDQRVTRAEWFADLARRRDIPLGRLGEAEEAAAAIAFLASPAAGYITGASLEVSGGLSRHI